MLSHFLVIAFLLLASFICKRYLSCLFTPAGMVSRCIMLKLRSSFKLIVDLFTVITSTHYEVMLGHSRNMWKWSADILPHLLQHCPCSGLLICKLYMFGFMKYLKTFFQLNSLHRSEPEVVDCVL